MILPPFLRIVMEGVGSGMIGKMIDSRMILGREEGSSFIVFRVI